MEKFERIYSYSRKRAFEDGVLIDVTTTAIEAGFNYPVAVTSAVWHEFIVPDDSAREQGQSIRGRLWDLLFTLAIEIRKNRGNTTDILFWKVLFVIRGKLQLVTLKSVCGPGDQLEPVITVMKENED